MHRSHPLRPPQFFLLFALCCLLPLAAAKLALSLALFSPGVSNKGEWLEHDVRVPSLASGRWQLLYVQAGSNDKREALAIYSLQQLYTGLGAKREQVSVGVIARSAPLNLAQHAALHWQSIPPSFPAGLQGQVILINREGQLLLHYEAAENHPQAYALSKKIRADLLRLLAFDRPAGLAQVE